jgi:hypothetical protein
VSAPADRYVDVVFLDANGSPQLARCVLLFLDLLGVTEMATSPRAAQNLVELEQAIRGVVRDFLDPASFWPAAMFSDAIVMASPVDPVVGEEAAIAGLLMQASWLQLSLAERGFFARGSIAVGDFYLRDEFVFGAALVQAYRLEREQAIHPRVILSKDVHDAQRKNLEAYIARKGRQPLTTLLLSDRDGRAFLNYLELVLEEATDPHPRLAKHRDALADNLKTNRDNSRVWDKYRWVSEYHNHFCNEHKDEDWFAPDLLIPEADLAQELHPVV